MRKRVGLARAIVLDPKIVLYDEPTTGLDPITTDYVDDMILTAKRELQVTQVVISHDIASSFKVADKVAFLFKGKIVAEGPPQELRHNPHPGAPALPADVVRQVVSPQGRSGDSGRPRSHRTLKTFVTPFRVGLLVLAAVGFLLAFLLFVRRGTMGADTITVYAMFRDASGLGHAEPGAGGGHRRWERSGTSAWWGPGPG